MTELNLLVLESENPRYDAIDHENRHHMHFVEEQHGRGPRHFASVLDGGAVLEFYPPKKGKVTEPSTAEVDFESEEFVNTKISTLALSCKDLDSMKVFYEAFGIEFTSICEEVMIGQDSNGVSLILKTNHNDITLDIFPLRRIGFYVDSLPAAINKLKDLISIPSIKESVAGNELIIKDPMGNTVSLVEKKIFNIVKLRGTQTCDVAIVGVGPVGGALGCNLGLSDRYDVKLFEQSKESKTESRASGLQPRLIPLLQEMGILDLIKRESIPILGSQIYRDGERINAVSFYNPKFESHGIGINQFTLENLLYDRLDELQLNVSRGKEIVNITQRDKTYKLEFRDTENDSVEEIYTPLVVACDGGRSFIRSKLNFDFPGTTYKGRGFAADCLVKTNLDSNYMHFFVTKNSRLFFVPLPEEGCFKISGNLVKAAQGLEELDALNHIFKLHNIEDTKIVLIKNFFSYKTHARVADTFTLNGASLCGDSAHLFPPRSGQGVTTGIEDAFALSKAIMKMNSTRDYEPLEDYAYLRRLNAIQKIDMIEDGKIPYRYSRLKEFGLDAKEENRRILRDEL